MLVNNGELHGIAFQILDFAKKLMARAVQHGDAFAPAHAQDMNGVVRFAVSEAERCLAVVARTEFKTGTRVKVELAFP